MEKLLAQLKALGELISEFPNGIGYNTLKTIYVQRYPHLSADELNLDTLLRCSEGKILKSAGDGASYVDMFRHPSVYFPFEKSESIYKQLYPFIVALGETSPILEMRPIFVSGNSSFFTRFPDDDDELKKLLIKLDDHFKNFVKDRRKKVEQVKLNAFYAVFDESKQQYQRVRVIVFDEKKKKYLCTLIDFGGYTDVGSYQLLALPNELNPLKCRSARPLAMLCILDLKDKIEGFPSSRRGLQIVLSYIDSVDCCVPSSVEPVKLRLLAYNDKCGGFVARLVTQKDASEDLLEWWWKNIPQIIEIDQFYTMHMENVDIDEDCNTGDDEEEGEPDSDVNYDEVKLILEGISHVKLLVM